MTLGAVYLAFALGATCAALVLLVPPPEAAARRWARFTLGALVVGLVVVSLEAWALVR